VSERKSDRITERVSERMSERIGCCCRELVLWSPHAARVCRQSTITKAGFGAKNQALLSVPAGVTAAD